MRLKPRYSLLTLLLLTALVAGTVQFWGWPHDVLERPAPNVEVEYSYIRDWRGNKIISGPYVIRINDGADHLDWVEVGYYRQGERLNWVYNMADVPEHLFGQDLLKYGMIFSGMSALQCWMSAEEQAEFNDAIAREKQRPTQQNKVRRDHEESNRRRRQYGLTFPGDND